MVVEELVLYSDGPPKEKTRNGTFNWELTEWWLSPTQDTFLRGVLVDRRRRWEWLAIKYHMMGVVQLKGSPPLKGRRLNYDDTFTVRGRLHSLTTADWRVWLWKQETTTIEGLKMLQKLESEFYWKLQNNLWKSTKTPPLFICSEGVEWPVCGSAVAL